MEGYEARTYGDAFADVYDDWYGDISDVDGTVAVVMELAAGGPVLELGIGTGRLALPLAAAGAEVHGVDASPAMIDALRAKPGGASIEVTVADMAELPVPEPGRFAVVLAAFNTFFNLPTAPAQQACLTRVAEALASGGRLIIEACLPTGPAAGPDEGVEVREVDVAEVRLARSWEEPDGWTIAGQHVEHGPDGVTARPWMIRPTSPEELDAMCQAVGLVLEHRWADWSMELFDPTTDRHVSVYRPR